MLAMPTSRLGDLKAVPQNEFFPSLLAKFFRFPAGVPPSISLPKGRRSFGILLSQIGAAVLKRNTRQSTLAREILGADFKKSGLSAARKVCRPYESGRAPVGSASKKGASSYSGASSGASGEPLFSTTRRSGIRSRKALTIF